jgi:dipeptidyl aminopeptidase/acylaminoacyl peptidase
VTDIAAVAHVATMDALRGQGRVISGEEDIRGNGLYLQAEALYGSLLRPGTGLICDAAEVSTNGTHATYAGTIASSLTETAPTRVCVTELNNGDTRVLTFGPGIDRSPKFSPDGRRIAFLSDRDRRGDFQLYLLDPVTGGARATPHIDGWVEYLSWSPNGSRVLLGVAEHGADVAGTQGAVASARAHDDRPAWMPTVDVGDLTRGRRSVWIYDLAPDRAWRLDSSANVWEAAWCGNDAIVAVVSSAPAESAWYRARLQVVDVNSGRSREIYVPTDQIGIPAGSPSGETIAVVEAVCSDRWLVAGDLKLIDAASGQRRTIDTAKVDITYMEWRSETTLLVVGHRRSETVVALVTASTGMFSEVWSSHDLTTAGRLPTVSGLGARGDFALIGESFTCAPEVAVVRAGAYRTVHSFDVGYGEAAATIATAVRVEWDAPDGLRIDGWLLRPRGEDPHPLVTHVHGGPVYLWRPSALGPSSTRRGMHLLLLLRRGYAVFLPNPRGSSGRGQEFARRVVGDMGGADALDLQSGLDHLVKVRIADPARLGIMGQSYGGFMAAWLVTRDQRFAAAVAVAPVTNQVTERLISNIPYFVDLFLDDTYSNPGGRYYQRSPVMFADRVRTPTLNICGDLDRCTPPEEAVQFHTALVENGAVSVLVRYPKEGHGVRSLPAAIDYVARVAAWFERHMPAAGH